MSCLSGLHVPSQWSSVMTATAKLNFQEFVLLYPLLKYGQKLFFLFSLAQFKQARASKWPGGK